MKNILSAIINYGNTSELSFNEQKKIKLVNGICLYGLLVSITFTLVFIIIGQVRPVQVAIPILNLIAFGCAFYLNGNNRCFISRVLICIYIPAFLGYVALTMPEDGGADISILGLSILPVFLFEKNKHILPLFIYCFLMYAFVMVLQRMEVIMPLRDMRIIDAPYLIGIFFAFLEIYIFTYMFKSEHTRYETTIIEKSITLGEQKAEIEAQKHEILSSISYAKRIQAAILPDKGRITENIPQSFILYKPKDIVSGDFYWFCEIDADSYIIVAGDCTGHGVPGAIMTVIGSTLLSQIIVENNITEPSKILEELDKRITVTLKQEKQFDEQIRDGMDLALLKVDKSKKELIYSNAKRPAIFIRNNSIEEFDASKFTMDGLLNSDKNFDEEKLNYQSGDCLYLFTDGYIDQFGGKKNKKFMIKQFRELLLRIHQLPLSEQKTELNGSIENWRGSNEQTDDILVIGIRFE